MRMRNDGAKDSTIIASNHHSALPFLREPALETYHDTDADEHGDKERQDHLRSMEEWGKEQ